MSWLTGITGTSLWDDLTGVPNNALYGTLSDAQKADVIAAGQANINGVVTNVQDYYSTIPIDTAAVQAAADANSAALVTDVNTINKGACGDPTMLNFSGVGLGCLTPSQLVQYILYAFVAGAILYALVLASNFIPSRGKL